MSSVKWRSFYIGLSAFRQSGNHISHDFSPASNGRAMVVFRALLEEKWPRDIGSALHHVYFARWCVNTRRQGSVSIGMIPNSKVHVANMGPMYCLVVRNIPLHIDYWWQDLSPLRLSGKLRGRRSYDVFSVFKIHACQRDESIVILAGFFAGFTGWCLSTTSSVSGGGSHVGMTTFSFQWITTEFFYEIAYILIP